jgi:hypothetical protein
MRADDDDGHSAVHGKPAPTKKAAESNGSLVGPLESSIDWAGEMNSLKARLNGASTKGELLEAWNDANLAIKNGMPKSWLGALSELKDQRKAAL